MKKLLIDRKILVAARIYVFDVQPVKVKGHVKGHVTC